MLARFQRAFVGLMLAACLAWAGACIGLRVESWAGAGPALLLVGYLLVIAVEFAWMRSTYSPDDALFPSKLGLLRCWLSEAAIAPWVFLWWQPFWSWRFPDCLVGSRVGHRGIVFVHGFLCNRGIWTRWLSRLDCPYVAVDLEPIFGSIDRYAATIDEAVRRIRVSTGTAPVVVAHSMGGLAVRAWLASSGRNAEVHRVVTIATPHGGTKLATMARARNAAQMAAGSPWLRELVQREDVSSRSRFICFWSHCDNVVFPSRLATLDGAENRHLPLTPHVQMVFHPEVFSTVMALVKGDSRDGGPTPTSSTPPPPPSTN